MNRDKIRFYLVFYILGIFFAETCSRSDPAGLYNPKDFVLLWTVYGTHYLVFGSYLLRTGRYRDRRKVYLFGSLLGLYEFPITKVFFERGDFYVHGVNVFNLFRIGFIRHAFMSFFIPFYLSISLVLNVDKKFFDRFYKRFILLAAFFFGLMGGLFGAHLRQIIVLPGLAFGYSYVLLPRRRFSPDELLINERKALLLLLFIYALYIPMRRRDRLPRDPIAYVVAALSYIIVIYLIFSRPAKERLPIGEPIEADAELFLRLYATFLAFGLSLYALGRIARIVSFAIFAIIALGSFVIVPYLFRLCYKNSEGGNKEDHKSAYGGDEEAP